MWFRFKYKFVLQHSDAVALYRHRWYGHLVVVKESSASEARMLMHLENCDGVQQLFESYREHQRVRLVLAFYDSFDAHERIQHDALLTCSAGAVNELILNIARCLQQCHQAHIAHLNLTFEHVMFHRTIQCYLISVGSSQVCPHDQLYQGCVTGTAVAPEFAQGQFGLRSDVYCLGTMYKMICHKPYDTFIDHMMDANYYRRPTIDECIIHFEHQDSLLTSLTHAS